MEALELTITGDEELQKKLDKMVGEMPGMMLATGMKVGFAVERELKLAYSDGPLQARSNRLERSVEAFVERGSSGVTSGAGTPVFYADVLERGAVITPVQAESLVFQLADGTWIATKRVVIPAFKAGQHAAERAEPEVRRIWSDGIKRFVER